MKTVLRMSLKGMEGTQAIAPMVFTRVAKAWPHPTPAHVVDLLREGGALLMHGRPCSAHDDARLPDLVSETDFTQADEPGTVIYVDGASGDMWVKQIHRGTRANMVPVGNVLALYGIEAFAGTGPECMHDVELDVPDWCRTAQIFDDATDGRHRERSGRPARASRQGMTRAELVLLVCKAVDRSAKCHLEFSERLAHSCESLEGPRRPRDFIRAVALAPAKTEVAA